MKTNRVLIACRDTKLREALRLTVEARGWTAMALDGVAALGRGEAARATAIVLASSAPDECARNIEVAAEIRNIDRHLPLLLVAGEISAETAVAALRAGANDLRLYPADACVLADVLARLMHAAQGPSDEADRMVGDSLATEELRRYLDMVAATDCNVLITGETGTGKELAALRIHSMSRRRSKPLIPVNCAAIPETLVESELFGHERGAFTGAHASRDGKFKLANGGTIFLDEVGDMDLVSQAKLLRAIESKEIHSLGARAGMPVDIRVVAATNQDPEELVREKRFRKDLYFRLNVARVHLKPLRERQEDIISLVAFAVQDLNRRFGRDVQGCDEEAMSMLMRYEWPGNVRELKNLLEATFISLPRRIIQPRDFPEAFLRSWAPHDTAPADEREQLLSALWATRWNKSKAAEALNWSRMKLYRKIAQYRIVSEARASVTRRETLSRGA